MQTFYQLQVNYLMQPNNMYDFIIWLFASLSMVIVITRSSLTLPIRNYVGQEISGMRSRSIIDNERVTPVRRWIFDVMDKLLTCSQCNGFWVGLLMYIFLYEDLSLKVAIFGLISSIVSFTYTELLEYIKRN